MTKCSLELVLSSISLSVGRNFVNSSKTTQLTAGVVYTYMIHNILYNIIHNKALSHMKNIIIA